MSGKVSQKKTGADRVLSAPKFKHSVEFSSDTTDVYSLQTLVAFCDGEADFLAFTE